MRKLVFMLKVKAPGSLTRNLNISTHKGARLEVIGNQATVLEIADDDDMSDSELLSWYKSRYSGFGMGIKLVKDLTAKAVPANPKMPDIKVKVEPAVLEVDPRTNLVLEADAAKDPVKPETVTSVGEMQELDMDLTDMLFGGDTVVQEKMKEKESVSVSKVEPKGKSGTPLDDMTYFGMVQFAKDHGIEVEGREKEKYVEKLTEWFKNHD